MCDASIWKCEDKCQPYHSHLLRGQSVCPWQPEWTTDMTPLLSSQNRYLIFPSTILPNPEGSDPLFMHSSPNCAPSKATPLYHNLIICLSLYPSDLLISTIFQFSYPLKEQKFAYVYYRKAKKKKILFSYCKHTITTTPTKMFYSQHSIHNACNETNWRH
jgi:hypothetical protein